MKYVYYTLAIFAALQALVVAFMLGLTVENPVICIPLACTYGVVSGSFAGKLFFLGSVEK